MKKKLTAVLLLTILLFSALPLQAGVGTAVTSDVIALDTTQMELLQGGNKQVACFGAVILLVGEATFGAAIAATGNVIGAAWWFGRMMGEAVAVVGVCA